MSTLNLFPARVAIGTVQPNGNVLMTPEFFRALTDLLQRVGGQNAPDFSDIDVVANSSAPPFVDFSQFADLTSLQVLESPAASAQAMQAIIDQAAQQVSESRAMLDEANKAIEDLQAQISQGQSLVAEIAKQAEGIEVVSGYSSPFRVDWERPGTIGSLTANTGRFTTLTSNGGAQLVGTSAALNNGAAAAAGTLTNAPVAGNPTKWVPINDNGTTRYIPAW